MSETQTGQALSAIARHKMKRSHETRSPDLNLFVHASAIRDVEFGFRWIRDIKDLPQAATNLNFSDIP
jgi:hypothetical protein